MASEAGTALRWLVRRPGLREFTLVLMAMNLLGGGFMLPLIVHVQSLGGTGALVGLVLTGIGIGGLLGALASSWITRHVTPGHLAIGVPAVFGLCAALAGLPLGPWWPFWPILAFSLVTPSINVASGAVLAELVPADMLGRVGSLLTVAAFLLAPLGPLLGGFLSATIGGGPTLMAIGAGLLLTAAVAAASRTLRTFGVQAPPPTPNPAR